LNYFGVDTSNVIFGGERMGLYYLEKGASQRPSKVIYDRANSAISKASPDEFDWETIFNNCDWFHFTGINPALGENMYIACINACKAAKAKNITISCDMNYRSKLWTEDEANLKMRELFKYVDVSIGNEEDADKIFGINAHNTDVERGSIDKKGYKEVARKICDQYGCKYAAITLRTSLSASVNRWAGVIYSNETDECHVSQEYTISIVDRVGSGDSFAAGIIYALLNEFGCKKSVEFAAAASCLKHTQEGDFNRSSVEDVFSLMYGDSSGRVRR
jgi:2-dehydro-3-deoxygluconokinase